MKYKAGVTFVILITSIAMSFAQNRHTDAHITGHIVDGETKEHIAYASVALKGTTVGGATDGTGHFFLKNLPIGEYILVASFIGYETVEKRVLIIANQTIEIKFELTPRALDVGEVVVTGSRNETNRRESSTIVNVMPARLFESTASSSPAEVLNFQSGLRVESTCGNCGSTELRINGLGGQYSQILLDSRPIFSSLAAVYGLEQLPVGMIERVEVVRGGGSALFGSSAIGGVVNIITKEPFRNMLTLSNNFGFLGEGSVENNLALNGAFVTDDYRAGVYLFGMVKNRDSYDRNGDGFSDIPKLASETLGFRGYYKISSSSKLTAEYHHIREFRRGGDSLNRQPHESTIAEQLRHNINGGGLKYDLFSSDYKHRLSLFGSLQYVDRESYFGTQRNPDAYGSTTDMTIVGGGQYTYAFDKFLFMPSNLTVGAEFTDNTLNDEMLGYNRRLDQHSFCAGTFLQNEWQSEKFSVLVGGRLDKHSKISGVVFNPRANVRYTPIREVGLRLSYSSGYRAPQAYDEDLHVDAVGGKVSIITIDPNLKPEYSNSVSASIDLYKRFVRTELNLLIEGFYTNINDVFTLEKSGVDDNGNQIWERRNGLGSVVKGVNLEAKVGLSSKLMIDAGYTFQTSRYKEDFSWSEEPSVAPQRRMFRSPDQYGYFTLNYAPVRPLSLSLNGNYTGSMLLQHSAGYIEKDEEKNTPTFFDMGLRVAYDFKLSPQVDLQLSGGVKNLFDHYQSDLDRGEMKDAKYIYGPVMSRSFYLGVKFSM